MVMKAQYLVGALVLGTLVLSPVIALAQNAPVPPRAPRDASDMPQVRRDGAIQGSTTTRAERREEMQEKMAERRSEILKRIAERMIKHLELAIERMEKIAERVDSRIAKLKERGVNTAASEALLTTAREKITAAKTAVANAKAEMANALAVADVDADGDGKMDKVDPGKKVRDFLATARNAVKDAHRALVEAIKSLKSSAELRGVNTGTTTTP